MRFYHFLLNFKNKIFGCNTFSLFYFFKSFIYKLTWIKTKRFLQRSGFEINDHWTNPAPSEILLDVVIVVLEKDLITLPEVIKSIRLWVLHPIKNIFVVSPNSENIANVCDEYNCINIDEENVMKIKKSDINFNVTGKKHFGLDRSGWIFQQLLKLSSDLIADQENILIVDADTIFTSPQVFIRDNKWVFNISDERHRPYQDIIRKLTNRAVYDVSFVSHHILLNRHLLQKLKSSLSEKSGIDWERSIIESIDRSIASPFSEYELYGNYILNEVEKEKFIFEYWHNKSLSRKDWSKLDDMKKFFYQKYKTISFHQHL